MQWDCFLQAWCAKGGYKAKGKKISPDLTSREPQLVANLLCRFFEWWVKDGRPGDPTIRGPMVSVLFGSTFGIDAKSGWVVQQC